MKYMSIIPTGFKRQNDVKTTFCVVESDQSVITYSMIKALLPPQPFSIFPGAVDVVVEIVKCFYKVNFFM